MDARGAGVYSVVPQFLTELSRGETEAWSEGARRTSHEGPVAKAGT
ncbi:MAG: hypothetical protein V1934_05535 [Methanobacteriota archaeon]